MASTSNNNNNLSESMQPDANFVSIDIRHLECTICMEIYVDPRRLPCGHLYCTKCLFALRNSVGGQHNIECPQCKKRSTLPVKQLMSDYLVKDMAENFKRDSVEHRVEVQALIYENIKLRKELEEAKRLLNEMTERANAVATSKTPTTAMNRDDHVEVIMEEEHAGTSTMEEEQHAGTSAMEEEQRAGTSAMEDSIVKVEPVGTSTSGRKRAARRPVVRERRQTALLARGKIKSTMGQYNKKKTSRQ